MLKQFRLDKDLAEQLKETSTLVGKTESLFIREAILEHINRYVTTEYHLSELIHKYKMNTETLKPGDVFKLNFAVGNQKYEDLATFSKIEKNVLIIEKDGGDKQQTLYTFLYKKNIISFTEDFIKNLNEEFIIITC